MSARKISQAKSRPEFKQEDLKFITQIRNLINNFLNSDKDAKKAAQVLHHWLQDKDKTKK